MEFKVIEHSSGCDEAIVASNLDEAIKKVQDWLEGGSWGDEEIYVSATITDEAGVETETEFVVGGPQRPACIKGEEHEWGAPHELVGGLTENPGIWGLEGNRLRIDEVCANCGCYRRTITESIQSPRVPERMTYRDPDKKSLAWAELVEVDDE